MIPRRPMSITLQCTACDHLISMGWQCPLHTSIMCPKAKGFTDPGPLCTCKRCGLHMIPAADTRRMQSSCAMTIVTKAHRQRECPSGGEHPAQGSRPPPSTRAPVDTNFVCRATDSRIRDMTSRPYQPLMQPPSLSSRNLVAHDDPRRFRDKMEVRTLVSKRR